MGHAIAAQATDGLRYGRSEIQKHLHGNFARGMMISILLHAVVIGSYYTSQIVGSDEDIPMVKVRILKYSDLGPPPSISQLPPVPSLGVQTPTRPSVGVPVPVPDAEVNPEQTFATQQELSATPSPVTEGLSSEDGIQVTQDITIEDDPDIDEFVPYEKGPVVVKNVVPKYPEMALRAGLEGTVWVKVLVDKDGKPKKAVVLKSAAEILNDAALEAAMQFVFTPAVMNSGAVRVWVAIPFKFQINDSPS
ncbi:MAG: energy transducer TonB [Bacteroidota bacterium]